MTRHPLHHPAHPSLRHRLVAGARRPLALSVVGALTFAGAAIAGSGVAQAAVPQFPDNIVVFPDRDFVSAEGYEEYVGQTALVEVTRPGVGLVGSATAVAQPGGVPFEVNHPGGVCWGAGTNLKVTPDIQGGDVVSIKFGGVSVGETTVAGSQVTSVASAGSSLTVRGTLEGSNPAQIEQRIIAPELRDTAVNRRDVRALPGPLAPAPKGGYQSGMDVSGSQFTATYEFDTADIAALAADGGARIMSWQEEDADANRQGLTISEFGELGGPGMGGCPNGPRQAGPGAPTNVTATPVSGGYKLNWTPAVAVPGTPAITGYQVSAVDREVSAAGEQAVIGKRIGLQSARSTTLTGLTSAAGYDLEIVSVSEVGLTFPAVNVHPSQPDVTAPTITPTPGAGSYNAPQDVQLASDEANTDTYYTVDGTEPYAGGALSDTALPYDARIRIGTDTTLKWVAFDTVGNLSTGEAAYTFTQDPAPAAPVVGPPSFGVESVTLDWNDVPTATSYEVQVLEGTTVVKTLTVTTSQATVTGLKAGASYTAQVTARNAGGDSQPTVTGPFTIPVVLVADAGASITAKRGTTVTLDGSASKGAASYAWTQTDGVVANQVTLTGAGTAKPTFAFPFYKWTSAKPMTNQPLKFTLTVTDTSGNTKAADVLVSPVNDRLTAAPRWKTGDFRITGTATTVGSTVDVYAVSSTGARGRLLGANVPVTAAVAPETGGVYTLRLRDAAANPNPGRVLVESSMGGSITVAVTLG